MLEHYWRWAYAADDWLRWLAGMPEPERFGDRGEALAWLDGERSGLVAAAQWAREERHAEVAVRLSECPAAYLDRRRYFDDTINISCIAQQAAHRAGDGLGEAGAWTSFGNALQKAGRVEEAIEAHTHARDLFQAAEDRHGEASAWNNLGNALQEAGRTGEAIDACLKALEAYEEFEDWYRAGVVLENLALAHEDVHHPAEARAHWLQAADAYTRADSPDKATQARAQAADLNNPPPNTPG